MSDDTGGLPRKNMVAFGGMQIEVTDELNVLPVFGEIITDLRIVNDVLWLSLGSFVMDGDSPPKARVCARLRIPMVAVADIQSGIQKGLDDIAAAKKTAN